MDYIFFDSYGNPWWTCSYEHPEAVAFGPTGAARRVKADGLLFSQVRARIWARTEADEWPRLIHASCVDGHLTYETHWGCIVTSKNS